MGTVLLIATFVFGIMAVVAWAIETPKPVERRPIIHNRWSKIGAYLNTRNLAE